MASRNFEVDIDLQLNQLLNVVVHKEAGDPATPVEGQVWYDETDHVLAYYDGSQVHHLFELTAQDVLNLLLTVDGAGSGLDADLLDGQHGSYYLNRANHTGTQAISTIVNLQDELDDRVHVNLLGVANGVATLDGNAKVPIAQLPDAVVGALQYQGTWDADQNSPALSSGVGTKGHYYVVSVAGTTNLDGEADWEIGDWVVFNGTAWQKIDNTDKVSSVNGKTGAVTLEAEDIPYDNTSSGASATDVQAAIDELFAGGGSTVGKYAETIGDGANTEFNIAHNLGTKDVLVSVYRTDGNEDDVEAEVQRVDNNTVKVVFAVAPAASKFRVVVLG